MSPGRNLKTLKISHATQDNQIPNNKKTAYYKAFDDELECWVNLTSELTDGRFEEASRGLLFRREVG